MTQLPLSNTGHLHSLNATMLSQRWLLLTDKPKSDWDFGPHSSILVDLENGMAFDLNELTRSKERLSVSLSHDGEYLLTTIDSARLVLIPTAEPSQWRTFARGESINAVGFTRDSQSIIYIDHNTTSSNLIVASIAGGQQTILASGTFFGWEITADQRHILLNDLDSLVMVAIDGSRETTLASGGVFGWNTIPDTDHVLVADQIGMAMIDMLSTDEKRRFPGHCAGARRFFMSDSKTRFLCSNLVDWHYVDLNTGADKPLPDIQGGTLFSSEAHRWAVFGTHFAGSRARKVPTQIIDLHTGTIVVRIDDSKVIDAAPDGSAVLVGDNMYDRSKKNIWLYGSDGSSDLLHTGPAVADASFSPNGQQIVLGNNVYDTDPVPGPIRLFDRKGNLVRTLDSHGISPVWLEQ